MVKGVRSKAFRAVHKTKRKSSATDFFILSGVPSYNYQIKSYNFLFDKLI